MSVTGESARRIQLNNPGIVMRSTSNNAAAVILDGGYQTNELITVSASDVTLAHFTVTRAIDHPIHMYPRAAGPDVTCDVVYGMRIIDGGEQFVKVNSNGAGNYVDRGRIGCSIFQLKNAGRPHIERASGGCYRGGIDCHSGRGWLVRRNLFEEIYCAGEGLAEHAVYFWSAHAIRPSRTM